MNPFIAPLLAGAGALVFVSVLLTVALLAPRLQIQRLQLEVERRQHKTTKAKLDALERHNVARWTREEPLSLVPLPPLSQAEEPCQRAPTLVADFGLKMHLMHYGSHHGDA